MTTQTTSNQDLLLALFKSKEGIESLGVTTYEGVMTFKELAEHFTVEANSDQLSEDQKKQRDVDAPRVNGLKKYWGTSPGTVFPNITLFANKISVKETHTIAGKTMNTAVLEPNCETFICDGQGRTTFIQWLLNQEGTDEFNNHTISYKLIVTNTESLDTEKATKIIKQTFADYHVNQKSPSASISKYFNSNSVLTRVVNECLELSVNDKKIKPYIALQGKIKTGQLWTYQQFTTMLQKFLNITQASAEKEINTEDKYQGTVKLCKAFLSRVFDIMPLHELDDKSNHSSLIFSRAIFANALGYVGRSLFDEMLDNEKLSWDSIKQLNLPISDKEDPHWQKCNVTMKDGDSVKIIKGTDKRLAYLICRELRIYPCEELAA